MPNSNYFDKYISWKKKTKETSFLLKKVEKSKAVFLFVVTTLVCAMPILTGLRLWGEIPEIVTTGIVDAHGNDDSIPRSVLVIGIPGLFVIANLICHGQLYFNQLANRLPPAAPRIVGRWGNPIISVFLASGFCFGAAGEKLSPFFVVTSILAILLLLLASHFFDCKRESQLALHFNFMEHKEDVWRITHRIAAIFWAIAGLLILFLIMFKGALPLWSVFAIIILLIIPILIGYILSRRKT